MNKQHFRFLDLSENQVPETYEAAIKPVIAQEVVIKDDVELHEIIINRKEK